MSWGGGQLLRTPPPAHEVPAEVLAARRRTRSPSPTGPARHRGSSGTGGRLPPTPRARAGRRTPAADAAAGARGAGRGAGRRGRARGARRRPPGPGRPGGGRRVHERGHRGAHRAGGRPGALARAGVRPAAAGAPRPALGAQLWSPCMPRTPAWPAAWCKAVRGGHAPVHRSRRPGRRAGLR